MMKFMMIVLAFVTLTGCYREGRINTQTSEVETPNGTETYKVTSGPEGRDVVRKVVTTPEFRQCIRNHAPTMGTSQADMYCRGVTSGSPSNGAYASNNGYMPAATIPVGVPVYGQVTMWDASSAATIPVAVPMPAAPAPAGDAKAMGALTRVLSKHEAKLKAQADEICELKKKQNLPCDEIVDAKKK